MLRQVTLGTFSLDLMPEIIKPAWEVANNEVRFTGAPLVPMGLENSPNFQQVNSRTGGLAKLAGEHQNYLSPIQIQHLMNGYLGPLGSYLYDSVDAVASSLGWVDPKAATAGGVFGDVPVVSPIGEAVLGRFATKTGKERATAFSNEFYDIHRAIGEFSTAIRNAEADKDKTEAERIMASPNYRVYKNVQEKYKKTARRISDIRSQMRKLADNKSLSKEERQEKIRAGNARIAFLQRQAVEAVQKQGFNAGFMRGLLLDDRAAADI
jgi:hypothetical protein